MKFAPLFLFVLLCQVAFSQPAQTTGNQKVGYADWDYIFGQMPEYKQIESAVKAHGDQLQTQMKAKAQEYESKVDYYQKNGANMLDAVRKDKETELTQLQQAIQKFQQDAQASLQKKQTDLMEPVFKKVGKAIDDVAKENGYTFIINPQLVNGGDILLYQDSKFDISALVLKKMGITVAAAQPK
jgi:outer membrane protein